MDWIKLALDRVQWRPLVNCFWSLTRLLDRSQTHQKIEVSVDVIEVGAMAAVRMLTAD